MTEPVVQIEYLGFSMGGRKILQGLSCAFESGRIHGIIGPNGSGKSTFLRNVCRIWEPEEGHVWIRGRDHRNISRKALSKLVTLVPQNTQVDFSIQVTDFVAMGRHPHLKRLQWLSGNDRRIVRDALERTGARSLGGRMINELSGGEAQLVGIARALATEAPILLLDEPTSALDIGHKLEIMDLLMHLRAEGKTVLVSVHDLDLARRYCDTITMLQEGAVFFSGSTIDGFSPDRIKEVFDVYVEETPTDHGISLLFHR
jgi:iron complex transport system ATP-binding protein